MTTSDPDYKDFQSLISQNTGARQFYNELPAYVREQIKTRGDIFTFKDLKRYADDLLQGDH